jgi:hypothetical protein
MFVPLHGLVAASSTVPFIGKHVPAFCAWLQLKQVPSQASLQQTPSTQFSDTQSPALAQVLPFLPRHSPCPSQLLAPEQTPSSTNLATGAHFPSKPGTAHAWHVPHAPVAQQTPSTQLPDAHSAFVEQLRPRSLRQAPVASQVELPMQASSVPFLTGEQMPALPVCAQLSQAPSHAVSQQTPSTQKPLGHWAETVQV